ncbi:hypothetical protein D048_4685, partial [Vibrio parahaemolyticus VPTS-2009]
MCRSDVIFRHWCI